MSQADSDPALDRPTITAEIATIGDELSRGEIIDTNAAWLGTQLFLPGLPGVPREMKPMFEEQVAPRLRTLQPEGATARRVYRVLGLGESHVEVEHHLAGLLDLDNDIDKASDLPVAATLHYRLAFPEVLVTIAAHGPSAVAVQARLERLDAALRRRLGRALYSEGSDDLPTAVGRSLRAYGATLAIAESCTGGMLGEVLTAVAGASDYFLGGVVSYANDVKVKLLGVAPQTLQQHGAVSRAYVEEMASGVRRLLGATYGVAVSGVAGPGGGTPDKPVGTVHVAVAGPDRPCGIVAQLVHWPGDREQVRRVATYAALHLLHQVLHPERLIHESEGPAL